MAKARPKAPGQLEMPLLTNLNDKVHLSRKAAPAPCKIGLNEVSADDDVALKATTDDLMIYQSISDSFLKRFR